MLRIRAAYDISFLGQFFSDASAKSGVYRTVEQLLLALCQRDDVALTALAICGQDPLGDITNSSRYVAKIKDPGYNFSPVLKGRFGFSNLYVQALTRVFLRDEAAGGNVESFNNQRAMQFLTRVIRRLEKPRVLFEPKEYDVVHSPFFKLPGRDITGAVPRVQMIFDLICQQHPDWMPGDIVMLTNRIIESIDVERDWVTCISQFTKDQFCDFTGMSPERVFVTPLAAANHFRPVSDKQTIAIARTKYSIPEGDYFLALGALQPRKNFLHIIRCFRRLITAQPNIQTNLVIVGATAWMYEDIFSAIGSTPELRDRITFTGFVAEDDLSAIYSGARAFLFSSLYEGFGLPTVEAMQCGTPVVTSNTSAFPEVIGTAGLLLDPSDEDSWCHTMLQLLTDDDLSERLSRQGLARAQEFTWAKCAEKTVDAYRIAAAHKP